MSSGTPIAKRSPANSTNAVSNSPLGMLASIASPPTAATTKLQPTNHRQQTGDTQPPSSMLLLDAHSDSGSASPSHSATKRKGMAIPKGLSEAADTDKMQRRTSLDDGGSAESSATAPVSGQSPPQSHVPASQLDVLALVTATSPPMPSRRRWAAAVSGNRDIQPAQSHDHSDGSDTVSEDETTLRSHSARIRSRYHAVQLRPLPHNDLTPNRQGSLDFKRDPHQGMAMSAKPLRFRGPSMREAAPQTVNQNGARLRRSSGETTETDDEQQTANAITPRSQRIVGYARPPNAAAVATTHAGVAAHSMVPSSEPALHRRTRRRRLHEKARGVVLSKQLSELTEETEDRDGMSHESSLSLSSSPSASPSRQQRMREKRVRARKRVQMSGSETETDTEMAARLLGSETETDPSLSNGTSTPSAGSGSANGAAFADSRNGTHRRVAGGSTTVNRLPPFAGDGASSKGGSGSRPMLPPIAQLDRYMQPRHQRKAKRADDGDNNSSGGETTETDEEFFSPPRAFHSSIRPPRRVVRHLASLRAQHSHPPAALQLEARPRPPHPSHHRLGPSDRAYSLQSDAAHLPSAGSSGSGYAPHYSLDAQAHTAPVSATDPAAGNGSGFGLGIDSLGYDHRGSGTPMQVRVVSTPESVAAPSIASSIRGSPRQMPGDAAAYSAGRTDQPSSRPARTNIGGTDSSSQTVMRRDPFAPGADQFTYRGAALRRLEKSYVRGNVLPNGSGSPSSSSSAAAAAAAASRKRALTAPSSYDPPGFASGRPGPSRPAPGAIGARTISSSETFFDDDHEAAALRGRANRSLASSNAGTPPEWNQPLDARIHPLGVSPVSSLRSSLLSSNQHNRPHAAHSHHSSANNSPTASFSDAAQLPPKTNAPDEDDLHDRPPSPSMDAAMRKSRKRQHSSSDGGGGGAMALPFSSDSKNSAAIHSPSSAKRRAHQEEMDDPTPSSNDVAFPPIVPDSPPA